jgi:toxin FitB
MYLIDTNIISEIRKGPRCNPNVAAWYRATREDELFLSVLVIGEIRQGIARLRPRNQRQAAALENWLDEILGSFGERVLPINEQIMQVRGRLNEHEALPAIDAGRARCANQRPR